MIVKIISHSFLTYQTIAIRLKPFFYLQLKDSSYGKDNNYTRRPK